MKKLIFISLIAIASALHANAWCFVSSCGKTCETVSRDFFPNEYEANLFYEELDKEMCGAKEEPEPEQPDEPIVNP